MSSTAAAIKKETLKAGDLDLAKSESMSMGTKKMLRKGDQKELGIFSAEMMEHKDDKVLDSLESTKKADSMMDKQQLACPRPVTTATEEEL